MKTILIPLLAFALLSTGRAEFSADIRQALRDAVGSVEISLREAGVPPGEPISVMPISGDQGRFVEGLLKNAVTGAGLTYVEGREDPVWDEILVQVEWDERKDDMLDPTTLDTFGKLKSTRLLLYGNVREASENSRQVYVELELHLTSIETKQHLWGDLVAARFYLPEAVSGIIDLDPELRKLLRDAIAAKATSIKANPNVPSGGTIAIGPIAGDIDGYIRSLAENLVSSTQSTAARLDASTPAEIQRILRDAPQAADAFLTGAVRDLSREIKSELPLKTIYEINAEVQLRIEDATTGAILWSDTIAATAYEERSITWWEALLQYKLYVAIAIGAILVLIFLVMFLGAMRRSR